MATGYTDGVRKGTVLDFREFAIQCARAFGATITMRDEPMDAPIPEAFQSSTYHERELKEAQTRLFELQAMTPPEADAQAEKAHTDAMAGWQERQERRTTERNRYQGMLAQVVQWQPPSADHEEFKRFMVDQLRSSIDFDCKDTYDEQPRFRSGTEWLAAALQRARKDIDYHTQHQAEENERVEGRNRWIKQLRDSVTSRTQPA